LPCLALPWRKIRLTDYSFSFNKFRKQKINVNLSVILHKVINYIGCYVCEMPLLWSRPFALCLPLVPHRDLPVGKWKSAIDGRILELKVSGECTVSFSGIVSSTGTYMHDGDVLTMTEKDGTPMTATFFITGDTFVIHTRNGESVEWVVYTWVKLHATDRPCHFISTKNAGSQA